MHREIVFGGEKKVYKTRLFCDRCGKKSAKTRHVRFRNKCEMHSGRCGCACAFLVSSPFCASERCRIANPRRFAPFRSGGRRSLSRYHRTKVKDDDDDDDDDKCRVIREAFTRPCLSLSHLVHTNSRVLYAFFYVAHVWFSTFRRPKWGQK